MALAAEFEARRGRDLRGLVDLAASELAADAPEPDAPVDLGGLDAVRLMTIHAAKGLEFPVVVVADLGRQGIATHPDLLVDGDRVGLRADRPGGPERERAGLRGDRRRAQARRRRRGAAGDARRADARRGAPDRLGVGAPGRRVARAAAGRAPIAWMAPALVPDVAALTPEDDVRERGAVRAQLNAPASGALRSSRRRSSPAVS